MFLLELKQLFNVIFRIEMFVENITSVCIHDDMTACMNVDTVHESTGYSLKQYVALKGFVTKNIYDSVITSLVQ
jgi:hypothetical protein